MEFNHHGAVHFGPIHVVDALHVDHVLLHRDLAVSILITLIVEMLVDWNVL